MAAARTLVADPPWAFGDKLPGKGRGAAKHYATLSIAQIKAFPLPPIADDALLFLWRVAAMTSEAHEVARAWGFEPKAELVWIKTTATGKTAFGMGRYVRNCHETCIIARRGKAVVSNRSVRSVFDAEVGAHSAKPDRFYGLVELLSPGPYAELFARRHRDGWSCFGNELPARVA